MRRLFSKLTAVALALIMAAAVPVTAFAEGEVVIGSDSEAPVFESIRFSKDTVAAGETLDFYVKASDYPSGVLRLQLNLISADGKYKVDNGKFKWDREDYDPALRDAPFKLDENGFYHGTWTINNYQPAGEYFIDYLDLDDKAGNRRLLIGKGAEEYENFSPTDSHVIPSPYAGLAVVISNEQGGDTTAPTIKKLTIAPDSSQKISAPGSGKLYIQTDDGDGSGTISVGINLGNPQTGKIIWGASSYRISDTGDEFYQEFDLDETIPAGDYFIRDVYLTDYTGNQLFLHGPGHEEYEAIIQNHPEELIPEEFRNIKFTVPGGDNEEDSEAPEFVDIAFENTTVSAPGAVVVSISAKDNGPSGIDRAVLRMINPLDTNKNNAEDADMIAECVADNGTLKGILPFGIFAVAGTYQVRTLTIWDKAGNKKTYEARFTYNQNGKEYVTGSLPQQLEKTITVTNEVRAYKCDNLNDITNKLNQLKSDEENNTYNDGKTNVIVAEVSENNATVSKDSFDAIVNSGAKVEFVAKDETYSWEFKGARNDKYDASAAPAQGIDLSANVNSNKNANEVKTLAGSTNNTLVVDFKHDGQLPATATVKIAADYKMVQEFGDTAYAYHYNDNGTPNDTSDDVLDEEQTVRYKDGAYPIEISHCSSYVITANKAKRDTGSSSSGGSGSYSGGSSSGSTVSTSTPSGTTSPASFAEQYNETVSETSDIINAIAAGNDIFAGGLQPGVIINFGGGTTVTAETTADGRTETVINYSTGDALPLSIMDSLKNSKDVRFVFSYSYQGVDYKVEITSEEAAEVLDPSIPWYGPLWLYGQFSPEAKAARKAAKEAAKAQK